MKMGSSSGLVLAVTVLAGGVLAAAEIKSGPQPGQGVNVFNPLHLNGQDEGKKTCPV